MTYTRTETTVRELLTSVGRVRLIALRGGEIELVRPVFAALSEDSLWLRFQTGMPRIPERYLAHLATVVPGRRQVLVALVDDRPVGHAEWTRDAAHPDTAELALTVIDRLHGQGIGLVLATESAARAAEQGIRRFTCLSLRENRPVRRWLARAGAVPAPHDPGEYSFAVADLIAGVAAHGSSEIGHARRQPTTRRPDPGQPAANQRQRERSTTCA